MLSDIFTQLTPITLPALMAAGYWLIGYIESLSNGEPFNLDATIRTIVSGLGITFLQALAGITIDPTTISTWVAFDGLAIVALSKVLGKLAGTTTSTSQAPAPALATVSVSTPAPATTTTRPYKMTDSVKAWLTFDATADNKALILAQIQAAEDAGQTHYTINYTGGYYTIDYGNLIGSGGNPSGIKTN